MGAGLGELLAEPVMSCGTTGGPRRLAGMPAVSEDRLRGWFSIELRVNDAGEPGGSDPCGNEVPLAGEPLTDPALNGLNESDGRLAMVILSRAIEDDLWAVLGLV